jgi:hypothetical protein
LYNETGVVTEPFIAILGAPLVVTYNQLLTDKGIILDGMWDESALWGFDPALVTSIHHCPILAATEGYS